MKLNKIQKIIYFYNSIVNFEMPKEKEYRYGNGVEFTKICFNGNAIQLSLTWKQIEKIQQAYKLRDRENGWWK